MRIMNLSFLKKASITFVFCALCAFSGYLLKQQQKTTLSDLVLSNIEALAQNENEPLFCSGSGSILCNGKYVKLKLSR